MREIKLLSPTVANQIAAGEVVTRPAAVVKELMENAVDAGASSITLILSQAGESIITVIDDGCGIPASEVSLAFQRHATSKIQTSEDIFKINTLGFRGEALASIASVAEVELKTKTECEEVGVKVFVRESQIQHTEKISMPRGTTITVYNLFYNTPARRKFLKSESYEKKLAIDEFEHVALSNPAIKFTLKIDDATIVSYPSGTLRDRVFMMAKKKVAENLIPVSIDTEILKMTGWVATPNCQIQGSREMYFFVNGRYMNPRFLYKAVLTAYGKLLPEGKNVPCYIYLNVPVDSIDVNVHPTKAEIKFDNEREIWDLVRSAIRKSIGSSYDVPTFDFDADKRIEIPSFSRLNENISTPRTTSSRLSNYNPFDNTQIDDDSAVKLDAEAELMPFTEDLPSDVFVNESFQKSDSYIEFNPAINDDKDETSFQILKISNKYIAVQRMGMLTIININRAQERIMYEKLYVSLNNESVENSERCSQRLLMPITLSYTMTESARVIDNISTLTQFGFEIGDMGAGTIAIYAIPAYMSNFNSFQDLFDDIINGIGGVSRIENCKQYFASTIAHTYSIRRDNPSEIELQAIVKDLFACDQPLLTPVSELPVMWSISLNEIDKKFKK